MTGIAGCDAFAGCPPVAPRELPSGADPGPGHEGVAGGTKQVTWGTGSDRLDLRIGVTFAGAGTTELAQVEIRGEPGLLYRSELDPDADLAISWREGDCDYTLFPAPIRPCDLAALTRVARIATIGTLARPG